MAKAKHVKLGEKASVFFDPTSGLKVTPGKAVELTNNHKQSKRVIKAIKSGHLDYVHDDELDDLDVQSVEDQQPRTTADTNKKRAEENKKKAQEKREAAKSKGDSDEDEDDEDEDEWTEQKLMRLKKPELKQMAKDNGTELSDEELEDFTKDELTEEILGLLEEDE